VTIWETAYPDDAELSERPLWDERTESLTWVDCYGGRVHRLAEDGAHTVLDVGGIVGAAALRENGGLVVARGSGLLFLGPDGRTDRSEIPFDVGPRLQFNDGACDPRGRLLIGTCSSDYSPGLGALYSVEPDGTVIELLSPVTESNGVGWSLDGQTMYYVDSGTPEILAFDYDLSSGRLGHRRTLVRFGDEDGEPDGLIVDAEGAIWVALWEGSQVQRLSPQGALLERLATPVSRPTCPALGGPDLDRLYVTTSWEGLDEAARRAEPQAGSVLVTQSTATGLPPFRFAG
jgi:sugar lactone lactonase YvrE